MGSIHRHLDEFLRARVVTQVVLVGVSTSVGVESTARSACDYGYNIALVTDAMTDRDAEAHRHSVREDLSPAGSDGYGRECAEALRGPGRLSSAG